MKFNRHFVFCYVLLSMSARTSALELNATTVVKYFDYQEFDLDGSSLNHETGFIPGLGLSLDHDNHRLWTAYAHGDVNYDGQLQSGTPHFTDTRQILLSNGYEYRFYANDEHAIELVAGFSAHRWQRHILPRNGIQGVNADYRWQQLHAGLRYKPDLLFNLPLEVDLNVFKTRKSSVDINLESIGYGSPELVLGDELGFEARLKYYKVISDRLTINFLIESTRRAFGRSDSTSISNGINTITIAEPKSVSWQTNIGITLDFRL